MTAAKGEPMKLPEPFAYKHYARKKPELAVLSWQSKPAASQIALGFVAESLYTEAQLKQCQRDALEAAAKICDAQVDKANRLGEAERASSRIDMFSLISQTANTSSIEIRKLMEGL